MIDKTHAEKIREAVIELGIASPNEIMDWIRERYPDDPVNSGSYRADIIGCSVNHSSSHHYPSLPKFLWFEEDTKRYRLARPEESPEKPKRAATGAIWKIKGDRIYYLMETPFEGRGKTEAEEFSRWLKEEAGYADTFIEEVHGFWYVYGDPGVTIEEVQKLIYRFALIDNPQELIEKLQWSTMREKPQETTFHVECAECGCEWRTKSQMNLVTCPSCGFKTPRTQSR